MTLLEIENDIDMHLDRIDFLDADQLKALIGGLARCLEDCTNINLQEEDTAANVQRVVPCLLRVIYKISARLASAELTWSDRQALTPEINNLTFRFERIAEKALRFSDALDRFEKMDSKSFVN